MAYQLLINGQLVAGAASLDVINPATEELLDQCPVASEAQLDEAVKAAAQAFPEWSALAYGERRQLIHRLADGLHADAEAFASLLTQEQGKPIEEARGEVQLAEAFLRTLADLELKPKVVVDDPDKKATLYRRPLGVVGAIVPWNFPVAIFSFKLAMALITGNTVVIKPAPSTPLTALKMGELMASIFPAGVVNVLADRNDLGAKMTAHPGIRKISFTGSTATGRIAA